MTVSFFLNNKELELACALIDRTWKHQLIEVGTIELSGLGKDAAQGAFDTLRETVDAWVQLVLDTSRTVSRTVCFESGAVKRKWVISLYAEEEIAGTEHWHLRASPAGEFLASQQAAGEDIGVVLGLLFVATTQSIDQDKIVNLEPPTARVARDRWVEFCWHSDLSECPLVPALRAQRKNFHDVMDSNVGVQPIKPSPKPPAN